MRHICYQRGSKGYVPVEYVMRGKICVENKFLCSVGYTIKKNIESQAKVVVEVVGRFSL